MCNTEEIIIFPITILIKNNNFINKEYNIIIFITCI